jgi:hypothetical protein
MKSNMKNLSATLLILFSSIAQADQIIKGDTLIRTLSDRDSAPVLFINPAKELSKALVYCASTVEHAKRFLSYPGVGGLVLMPGTKIIYKRDPITQFDDGTNFEGTTVQIECK